MPLSFWGFPKDVRGVYLDEGHLNHCTDLALKSFHLVRFAVCQPASMHDQGLTAVQNALNLGFQTTVWILSLGQNG